LLAVVLVGVQNRASAADGGSIKPRAWSVTAALPPVGLAVTALYVFFNAYAGCRAARVTRARRRAA